MPLKTFYIGQNIENKIMKVDVSALNEDFIRTLLLNKLHLAKVTEVLDLEQGRASRSAKHVKKYLSQKILNPFEILIFKN
jgi:hypothetical protein